MKNIVNSGTKILWIIIVYVPFFRSPKFFALQFHFFKLGRIEIGLDILFWLASSRVLKMSGKKQFEKIK
jgi:hypothetical protein